MAHRYIDPYSGKSKSLRYNHLQKGKQKLQHLMDIGGDRWYPWPVVWSDYEYDKNKHSSFPTKDVFLQRNWRGNRSSFYKKLGHRKIRRKKYFNVTNETYNKAYEFWWELD